MNFKEAMISLEEIRQYFLDLLVELSGDKACLKSDKFGVMILNAYCAVEMACKPFRPVNDIIFLEENVE